ncbi:MAG: transcription termination/antitermination protein NusA, partial [Longicatena sp.]
VETSTDSKEENVIVEEKVVEKEISERVETDLEIAARIAKEKQKTEGLNVKEKQTYKSKFENLADVKTRPDDKPAKPKYKKYDEREKEEIHRKPTFDLSGKDYEMKPIYSAEELDEIAKSQKETEENDWIHDEIDFDEFDKYYEE